MSIVFKLRRGSAADWTAKNPYLSDGEPGLEIEAGTEAYKIKFGPGRWNDLPYYTNDGSGGGGTGTDSRIGDMSQLSTTDKSSVVNAINEVNVPPVSLTLLYANAKAG